MAGDRRRLWQLVAAGLALVPTASFADGLIPWPWLESSRYRAWRQERDEQKAAFYSERAKDPVGARQFYYKGKEWPPFARPRGASQVPTHIYHAAHYWPVPYVCQDRQAVAEYEQLLENAGWVSETTLYDYHFDKDQHQLNRAGLIHLRWILENAPEARRTVYVQAGANNGTSQMRVASVQGELTDMLPTGNLPPIVVRITTPLGRPASEVDKIQRSETESTPKPRITPPFSPGGLGDAGATEGAKGL